MQQQMIDTTYRFHPDNTLPTGEWVFVFGSNLGGRHGKGAAKVAHKNFRAEYGVGAGPTGQAYAIPTKDKHLAVLPLEAIRGSVDAFVEYAKLHPKKDFFITAVGTGLAGYADDQIGPMFAAAPPNCSLPAQWRRFVDELRARARAAAA
jgi:hypothetical protein